MANRRAASKRPASSEEVEYWSHAASSLSRLSTMYSNPATIETIGRVNRLLSAWPADGHLPAEGYEGVKSVYKKLTSGLNEITTTAAREADAIDDVIEQLSILIALRKASESIAPVEKRVKRPRVHSPPTAQVSAPVAPIPAVRSMSITVPPRNSVGPQSQIPFSRDPKARREALAKQLPLREGRKIAFHPPQASSKSSDSVSGGKDEEWILAVVTKCINQDKNRYEVQDAEPVVGQPGQYYNTTLRAIIPLPDPVAPPDSAAHLNAYPEFVAGSIVMALYPDTTCFYRAEVLASPSDMPSDEPASPSDLQPDEEAGPPIRKYLLRFEDDDDQEHTVSAEWVVEWPGGP